MEVLAARAAAMGRPARLDARPRLRTVILTCMDARIDPASCARGPNQMPGGRSDALRHRRSGSAPSARMC